MPWDQLLHHEQNIDRFRHSLASQRLASTYLFVGPPGIGKRLFAQLLAEALLCEKSPSVLQACGVCPACQQVQSQTHPDMIVISKPADKGIIPVDLFIGEKEHRRQVGLVHDIGLKPFRGGRKIAIVDDADCLNQEGANSLLKTLEEPPPKSVLILIGTSEQQQLQTILSRSQVIRFNPLTTEQVTTILGRQSDLETEIPLETLAAISEGSVARALQLSDPEIFEFRQQLFQQLGTGDPSQHNFAKTLVGFVDAAGKESAKKRERLLFVADLAIRFFSVVYQRLMQQPLDLAHDPALESASAQLVQNLNVFDTLDAAEFAGFAIERSMMLQAQVHANVHVSTGVDAWLLELGKICRGKSLLTMLG